MMTIAQAYQVAVQHHQAGRLAEAEAIYRQILALDPRHADCLHLLGVLALQAGRHDTAADLIRQASALNPNDPAMHSNLGEACRRLGLLDEAIAECRRAIEIQPGYADARLNLGVALSNQGQLDEAIAEFCRVVEIAPQVAPVHFNLGLALCRKGLGEEAVAAFQRALQLQPDFHGALVNLGVALSHLGQQDEAVECFQKAIKLQPAGVDAHINLGTALSNQGLPGPAIEAYRTALRLNPALPWVHTKLLETLHYPANTDPAEIFREHRRWDEIHARPLAGCIEPPANDPNPERRLRIGYVSADFRSHSVAFFLETLLAAHDPGQVEVFCYSDVLREDAVTGRFREGAGNWREITKMGDAEFAETIRQDRIDILADLAAHTTRNRLLVFARRPAPVQVTWLGYCDTTGMRTMDYRLTDACADPPGMTEHFHSEELVRLPETFACFRPADESPPIGPLPALTRGYVTFASFHILAKLNDPLLENWARILRRVPGSRLRVATAGLGESSDRRRLSAFFAARGIDAARVEFSGRTPLAEYLAMHNEVDVLLDSHPFSGHTVSCHALWMGVPVVTLAGDRHCARMVASVLTNVGLPELIARTPAEYVEIASALAADRPRLASLRGSLRERMASSPLTDGPRFARNVEAAYRTMWRRWCARQQDPSS